MFFSFKKNSYIVVMERGKQITLLEMIKECEDEQCIEKAKGVKRELKNLKNNNNNERIL